MSAYYMYVQVSVYFRQHKVSTTNQAAFVGVQGDEWKEERGEHLFLARARRPLRNEDESFAVSVTINSHRTKWGRKR